MAAMVKGPAVGSSETQGAEHRSRRKRGNGGEPPPAFVRAFVDALRDILQDERRRAA
jgi:hypothetical protein